MSSSLREQLQEIYDAHGHLTPSLVVDVARDPDHPLHSRFEWDDSVAAEKWRQEQGHELIRSVRVTYRNERGESNEVRAFHAFRAPEGGHRYEPVERVVQDDMLTKLLRAEMERDWRTLKRRYEQYDEFYQMIRGDLSAA